MLNFHEKTAIVTGAGGEPGRTDALEPAWCVVAQTRAAGGRFSLALMESRSIGLSAAQQPAMPA